MLIQQALSEWLLCPREPAGPRECISDTQPCKCVLPGVGKAQRRDEVRVLSGRFVLWAPGVGVGQFFGWVEDGGGEARQQKCCSMMRRLSLSLKNRSWFPSRDGKGRV